jgi:CRP-like cAMP-binding protein
MRQKRAASVRPPPAGRPPPTDGRPRNRLLAALPLADYQHLLPHLKTVPIHARQVLHKTGEPLQVVYFPNGGVASITTVLLNGAMVEVATVGDEGMLGVEAFLSEDALAAGETLMRIPDTNAETLSVEDFRRVLAERGALHALIGRYVQAVLAQIMQSTACNTLHQAHQRCARWLLSTHDRMHQQDFQLSHESLAIMLGVQRPTVSVVAGALQKAGLIRYAHGHVRVLDRRGLEAASCECYPAIRALYDRLRF